MTAPRRELPHSWAVLKAELQKSHRLDGLLARFGFGHLKPDHKGRIWPVNPWRDDKRPGSFNIAVRDVPGLDAGAFNDFAVDNMRGDIFDLIARCERHADKMSTYWWCLEWLGWGQKGAGGEVRTKAQADQDRAREEANRKAAAAKVSLDAENRRGRLLKYWLDLDPIAGTLAEVYLRQARGIDLSRLAKIPGALRFDPACQHIDDESGEVTVWPAMVSHMTRGAKLAGLHLTWLGPDGLGKAPVSPPKKMRGGISGAAIRLSQGRSLMSPAEAAEKGRLDPLIIGEGIETALTCAVAQPGYRAWAAGSLSLMALFDWPPCASAVILLKDNDWKPEALKAFERVENHWRSQAAGRPVKVVGAAVGNDFNDWVRG